MEKSGAVRNWLESAAKNVEVANDMYKLGHYNWCLFMWHLAIEKVLKAVIISQDQEVPYVHDLVQLVKQTDFNLAELSTTPEELTEITAFNLEARYS